jgi:hypothetical protein
VQALDRVTALQNVTADQLSDGANVDLALEVQANASDPENHRCSSASKSNKTVVQ